MTEISGDSKRGRKRKAEREFDHQYTLRIRTEDRDRFSDYAWRNRICIGEAFKRMLDAVETIERVNEAIAAKPPQS